MTNMDGDDSYDFLFKIVLIGEAGVGKTCIVQRFKNGTFLEKNSSTIGVDFSMKTLSLDNKKVKLQIWDTAGQERFRTITQSYYRSANGVILAYDITQHDTFAALPRWYDDVRKYAGDDALILLIGNKKDLTNIRQVAWEDGKKMADTLDAVQFLETSAKDNTNVDDAFVELAKALKRQMGDSMMADSGGISIGAGARPIQDKWKCCGS